MNQSRFFHWLLPVLPDDSVLVVSNQNQSDIHSHSENNYNAVYLDGVLDLDLLKEVRRILKPEGTLFTIQPLKNFNLQTTKLLINDNQEVAGTTGRIKNPQMTNPLQ